MQKENQHYNIRKVQILKYALSKPTGIKAENLVWSFGISHALARRLLFHYHEQELLNRPRRGVYRISKRGKDRLRYLELRQDIEKKTGVPIGLNYRKDHSHGIPMHEILKKYVNAGGQIPADISL